MSTKPPLDLTAVVTTADNATEYRWASHLPAGNRPQGISFTTARFDGFKAANCRLSRRIDQDYADVNLLNDFKLIGVDGSVAYEGRVSAQPRTMDATHSIDVQAAGWMAHAKDRKFTEIYVDRDLSRWGPASAQYRFDNVGGFTVTDASVLPDVSTGAPSLGTAVTGPWESTAKGWGIGVYDAHGLPVGSVYYAWKKNSNVNSADTNWTWDVLLSASDRFTSSDSSGNLRAAGPGTGTLTATTTDKVFAAAEMYYNAAATGAGQANTEYAIYWTCLAVYGTHGLTKQGTNDATNAQGFYASDVIRDVVSRFCPKLNAGGVQSTSYVIPQLAFVDGVYPYEAFQTVNSYHRWGLEVWENRTLYFGPVDLTVYDWQVRLSDPGVAVDLQGDSTDDLANGIVVTYRDLQSGDQKRLIPDAYSDLRDDSVDNPANRAGLNIWTEIALSAPSTQDAALQIGRVALAEFNQPKAPGTITVRGHVRDSAGHWQQGWKVRAGDTIAIVDHPNDRPRLISETSWDHDNKQLQVHVEGLPNRVDAFLDRLTTQLAAANLS